MSDCRGRPVLARWLCLLLALLCTSSCEFGVDPDMGTETGNPPVALRGALVRADKRGNDLEITGAKGTVDPGGSTVVVLDLDSGAVLARVVTQADGSFTLVVHDVPSNIGLRAEHEGRRSSPVEPLADDGDAPTTNPPAPGATPETSTSTPPGSTSPPAAARDAGSDAPASPDDTDRSAATPSPADAGAPSAGDGGSADVADAGARRPSIPNLGSFPSGPTVIDVDRTDLSDAGSR